MAPAQSKLDALLSKKDLRLAYKILETECPFPADKLSQHTPLTWKRAECLGKALSLEPGCVYMHLLTMASVPLAAVNVRYSGVLGVFSNLMFVAHGASGDGSSGSVGAVRHS